MKSESITRELFSFLKSFPSKIDSGDLHCFLKQSAFLLSENSRIFIGFTNSSI